jgi:hypothetical protein
MTVKYKDEIMWLVPWCVIYDAALRTDVILQMAHTADEAKEIASKVLDQIIDTEKYNVYIGIPVRLDIHLINEVVENE